MDYPINCRECGLAAAVKQRGDKFVVVCREPGGPACCETNRCATAEEAVAAWEKMNEIRMGG